VTFLNYCACVVASVVLSCSGLAASGAPTTDMLQHFSCQALIVHGLASAAPFVFYAASPNQYVIDSMTAVGQECVVDAAGKPATRMFYFWNAPGGGCLMTVHENGVSEYACPVSDVVRSWPVLQHTFALQGSDQPIVVEAVPALAFFSVTGVNSGEAVALARKGCVPQEACAELADHFDSWASGGESLLDTFEVVQAARLYEHSFQELLRFFSALISQPQMTELLKRQMPLSPVAGRTSIS